MKDTFKFIKSPLQMVGFYLVWIETALAASLWPLKGHDELLVILLYAVVGIALIFSLAMVFVLIFLVLKEPRWLFNPSDYDPSVQDELFKHDHSISEASLARDEAAVVKVGDNNGQA
ncbi:hypothetical protein GM661_17965 [Iocasia frigidifontis]|uniref:Uncharacterized protein n=1 Tax=Iocasia fonsfrigidae TaxID=2682810 RepID=A0A8A7KI10_9FIRM|nr:hypothetical protein [Iocasia fonsfrigidae]QTL99705.1 hypothetical protein GM661_17965 [Iocasia fonsfrigidae]